MKLPVTTNFPVVCRLTLEISWLAPVPTFVEKVVSMVPSVLRRTILPTVEPFHDVKLPTMMSLPSDCCA